MEQTRQLWVHPFSTMGLLAAPAMNYNALTTLNGVCRALWLLPQPTFALQTQICPTTMAVGAIYHFSTSISLSLLSYKLQNIRVALFLYSIEGGFWTVPHSSLFTFKRRNKYFHFKY
jgi:hypothetical protein